MNALIWNSGGILVYLTGATASSPNYPDPVFTGIAKAGVRLIEWTAAPNPNGFAVQIVDAITGRSYSCSSTPTFNLALEVGAFIRHEFGILKERER